MKLTDLQFDYPERLVATVPKPDFRVLFQSPNELPQELNKEQLLEQIAPGDVVVINDTKVEKRRVFSGDVEIVFIDAIGPQRWSVLFPAKKFKVGDVLPLPGNIEAKIIEKGLPQVLETSQPLDVLYFENFGEPALPPYIQKARGERHANQSDDLWYQTEWAQNWGSVAAPTASLHFTNEDFEKLKARGVEVVSLTLHVGLGTFLPIKSANLDEHIMHSEKVVITKETIQKILSAKNAERNIWALGTTVCRSLESWALDMFQETPSSYRGETELFIKPGFEFKIVDRLMTNFHQPESTLLALVAGFAGLETVRSAYDWAIKNEFRLFSYGDLSVWTRTHKDS